MDNEFDPDEDESRMKPAPLREACLSVLNDGEWHTFREVYYKVESVVRPEVAIRMYHQKARGRPRVHEEPFETQLEKGKTRVIGSALSRLGVEYRGNSVYDPDREVRLDPTKGEDTELITRYGGEAVRVLMSIPVVHEALGKVNGSELNPYQRFIYDMTKAVST